MPGTRFLGKTLHHTGCSFTLQCWIRFLVASKAKIATERKTISLSRQIKENGKAVNSDFKRGLFTLFLEVGVIL